MVVGLEIVGLGVVVGVVGGSGIIGSEVIAWVKSKKEGWIRLEKKLKGSEE